jgi:hypothetical protein
MEFLALLTWLVLAGAAMVLAPFAVTTPGSAMSVMAAFGGVAVSILFLVLGAPEWVPWVQAALALLGLIGVGLGALQLNDGQLISGTVGEELQASALGIQWPFYFIVLFIALLFCFNGVDAVI